MLSNRIMPLLKIAASAWRGLENSVAALILTAMLLLPLADALFRKLFQHSLPGVAEYVAHGTLWIAFVGGSLASRSGTHLRLSTGRQTSRTPWKRGLVICHSSVSVAMAASFVIASIMLVWAERSNPLELAPFLPSWVAQLPMPIFMAAIMLRFVLRAPLGSLGKVLVVACSALLLCTGFTPEESRHLLLLPVMGLLLVSVLTGAPLFVFLGGAALFLFFKDAVPISAVPSETYRIVSSPSLPTIPLFTFAGYIMAEGGASKRLVKMFRAFFGWLPGGIPIATVVLCAFFTTFTGASSVTILALGGLLLPILIREQYPEKFSLGLVTASGSLGILFPPALPIILYSVVAAIPINQMFLAGITPGLLLVLLMALYGVYVCRKRNIDTGRFSAGEAIRALRAAKWDLPLPVIIITGIFSGLTTLVEAAAITALYAVILECFIHRELKIFSDLPRTVVKCGELIGGVLIILGVAFGLTNYLIDAEVPALIFTWVKAAISSKLIFLLALNLFLIGVGCIMDIFSAIVVIVPILIPIATAYGIHPVHLGILFMVNLELGYLTPPVGLNLFFSAYRFGMPLPHVYRTVLPFLALRLITVILVTYCPILSLWLIS